MSQPQSGWYPDPQHERRLRWWDGVEWTGFTAVRTAGSVQVPARVVAVGVAVVLVIVIAIGVGVAVLDQVFGGSIDPTDPANYPHVAFRNSTGGDLILYPCGGAPCRQPDLCTDNCHINTCSGDCVLDDFRNPTRLRRGQTANLYYYPEPFDGGGVGRIFYAVFRPDGTLLGCMPPKSWSLNTINMTIGDLVQCSMS